jgi:cytochrome P450
MRATRMAYCYRLINGTLPFDMLDIHQKYGHVVRIAPDELAFADHEAWKEIMGHRIKENQRPEFEKSTHFYRPLGGPSSLINCGREEHGALRRLMSHGFSDRSLREQQPLITKYVDILIQRLHENCNQPVDIMSWYNFTTFDVIGDLAFGEPFGCLNDSDYHPWVRIIFQMVKLGSVLQVAGYFPLLRYMILRILSSKALRVRREEHTAMTRDKLLRRMELGASGGRPNLINGLLQKQDGLVRGAPQCRKE